MRHKAFVTNFGGLVLGCIEAELFFNFHQADASKIRKPPDAKQRSAVVSDCSGSVSCMESSIFHIDSACAVNVKVSGLIQRFSMTILVNEFARCSVCYLDAFLPFGSV